MSLDVECLYRFKKHLEYLGKKMVQTGASCVPPDQYGARFIAFMKEIFTTNL